MDRAEVYIFEFSEADSLTIAEERGEDSSRGQRGYLYVGHADDAEVREEKHKAGYQSNEYVYRFKPPRVLTYTDHVPPLNRAEAMYLEGAISKSLLEYGYGVLGDGLSTRANFDSSLDVQLITSLGPCLGELTLYFKVPASKDRIEVARYTPKDMYDFEKPYRNVALKAEKIRRLGRMKFDASGINKAGGRFSINEHQQLVIRTSAPKGHPGRGTVYLVAFENGVPVTAQLNVDDFTPSPYAKVGDAWGKLAHGSLYKFVPNALSSGAKPEVLCFYSGSALPTELLESQSELLGGLQVFMQGGGLFKVNHHGIAFSFTNPSLYLGRVDTQRWFSPLSGRASFELSEEQQSKLDDIVREVVLRVNASKKRVQAL